MLRGSLGVKGALFSEGLRVEGDSNVDQASKNALKKVFLSNSLRVSADVCDLHNSVYRMGPRTVSI